jgi:hypothetical protein
MGETHLRNLAAMAGVRVVAVVDERAERAELGKFIVRGGICDD